MRLFVLIFAFFVCSEELHAQDKNDNPPNTLRLNEQLLIDQSPVTNLMYLEFIDSIKNYWNHKLHDTINAILPNKINQKLLTTNLNKEDTNYLASFVQLPKYEKVEEYTGSNTYLRHPKHKDNPVLLINKKQAELYCIWRSDMVNLLRNKKAKNPKTETYVNYRLPSESEFELARELYQKTGRLVYSDEALPSTMFATKEKFTVFNLSEFTIDKNAFRATKNWQNKKSDNQTATNYNTFRCICEVSKRN